MQDFPPHLAQQIEARFFQPVDSQAADALAYMERDGSDAGWTDDLRSAWGRFLISLLLRCPEDMEKMRSAWKQDFLTVPVEIEEQFRLEAADGEFSTFRSFLENLPRRDLEKPFFELLISLMNSKLLGEFLINMHWVILDVAGDRNLYTSDRPIIKTDALDHPNGHIVLPIGPTRLFLAATSADNISIAKREPPRNLTRRVNEQVIQHAVRYSYTQRDDCRRFVENRMSTVYQTRLADRLGAARKLNL